MNIEINFEDAVSISGYNKTFLYEQDKGTIPTNQERSGFKHKVSIENKLQVQQGDSLSANYHKCGWCAKIF